MVFNRINWILSVLLYLSTRAGILEINRNDINDEDRNQSNEDFFTECWWNCHLEMSLHSILPKHTEIKFSGTLYCCVRYCKMPLEGSSHVPFYIFYAAMFGLYFSPPFKGE